MLNVEQQAAFEVVKSAKYLLAFDVSLNLGIGTFDKELLGVLNTCQCLFQRSYRCRVLRKRR